MCLWGERLCASYGLVVRERYGLGCREGVCCVSFFVFLRCLFLRVLLCSAACAACVTMGM